MAIASVSIRLFVGLQHTAVGYHILQLIVIVFFHCCCWCMDERSQTVGFRQGADFR